MDWATVLPMMVLGFILGRVYQKWADGTMETEEMAFCAGREQGYENGYDDGRSGRYWPPRPYTGGTKEE